MHPQRRLFWFRRLALAGALLAAAVVVLGAWVRLTSAGLGCPDWPGCYGHIYPNAGQGDAQAAFQFGKALHEMIHRYFAATLVIIIFWLLVWVVRFRRDRDQPVIPVALLFVVVCLQGALGAFTVTMLLKPLIVTAHLLGGLSTLGLLWWLSLTPETRQPLAHEAALRKYALVALAVLVMQIALGGWTSANYAALACGTDFPTCLGQWQPPTDFHSAFVLWRGVGVDYEGGVLDAAARTAIQLAHRFGALIVFGYGILIALLAVRRGETRALAVALAAALLLQVVLGIGNVVLGLPLPVATAHNGSAALLLLVLLALVVRLRPMAR